MQITLTGVKPYDGTYELDFATELTTREWGWIKRLAGYLPLALEEAAIGGDPEFACCLAVIALRRAGRIENAEVPAVFERLIDAPFGSALTIDVGDEPEEDDAGPPALSSNGNESSSGPGSLTSSATSAASLPGSGTPASGSSGSLPVTPSES